MNCPKCGGNGFVPTNVFGVNGAIKCDFCDGTGVFITNAVEPITNEEWIKSANTEQLAEFLADKCNEVVETVLSDASCDIGDIDNDDYWYRRKDFVEWLKQPHTKE